MSEQEIKLLKEWLKDRVENKSTSQEETSNSVSAASVCVAESQQPQAKACVICGKETSKNC